jgi:hypothetical protein
MDDKAYGGLSAGILLIGLGIVFLVPGLGFWPWILVVLGAAGLPASLATQRGWLGWQGFFWMVGLAILFASGHFWPGILILVGVSLLVGALTRESEGSPFAGQPQKSEERAPVKEPFSDDRSE